MYLLNFLFLDISLLFPKFSKNHLMLSKRNIKEGRWYTLITASFTHESIIHYMLNIFSFLKYSPYVLEKIGNKLFGIFILSSIVISNSIMLLFLNDMPLAGLSGVVCAMAIFYAAGNPDSDKSRVRKDMSIQLFSDTIQSVTHLILLPKFMSLVYYGDLYFSKYYVHKR